MCIGVYIRTHAVHQHVASRGITKHTYNSALSRRKAVLAFSPSLSVPAFITNTHKHTHTHIYTHIHTKDRQRERERERESCNVHHPGYLRDMFAPRTDALGKMKLTHSNTMSQVIRTQFSPSSPSACNQITCIVYVYMHENSNIYMHTHTFVNVM